MGRMDADNSPEWLASGAGRRLLREESSQVALALDSIFGDQFVQIGHWGPPGLFLRHARTRRSALVAPVPGPGVDLVCAADCLAIANDSVDAVLLPHILESTEYPHVLLREVDRILRPDGHIIALGFNPVGLWGLRRLLSRGRFPPGLAHVISEHRLRDWLQLLSFSAAPATFCHFAAPLLGSRDRPARPRREPPSRRLRALSYQFMKKLRHQRLFAACYLVVARKEVLRLTPIRPRFGHRRKLVGGLVNPTTRSTTRNAA